MTCLGEGLANVKLKWLCFPSSHITEQYLYAMLKNCNGNSLPFPYFYSNFHSYSHDIVIVPPIPVVIPWVGTNLIHDFTAVTFSVKLAFFREKRPFPCFREIHDFSWILTLLLSFMKVFRVLSTAFVQILLFATCDTSALSSWHVFTVLLTYIQSRVLT